MIEQINIKDYKVFIFDLDDTLYLHCVDITYRDEYSKKIRDLLRYLKCNDKIVCLATHNKSPYNYLYEMEIYELFDEIICEKKNINSWNNIYDYTNKKDMIAEILEKTNSNKNEVIFFDDHIYNINQVKSIGINTVYVSPITGIIIENLKK